MEWTFYKAGMDEIDRLTEIRAMVLRAANGLPEEADMSEVKERSRQYYAKALGDGTHIAYLVYDGDRLIGTGAVSFFRVMPTCCNPSGEKAYIMNMYTDPAYRRRGVATQTLDRLVKACRARGITAISLEATEMGRPVYEKYGFVKMNSEMELPPDTGGGTENF